VLGLREGQDSGCAGVLLLPSISLENLCLVPGFHVRKALKVLIAHVGARHKMKVVEKKNERRMDEEV